MKIFIKVLSFLALTAGGTQHAMAVPMDFDFSGNFVNDNDIVLLDFTVGTDSTITIFSSSWIDGGFDPILAIWDGSGTLVAQQDDGNSIGTESSNGTVYDYGNWDSYFEVFLTAGDYTASIAMFNNFAVSTLLADGFERDGEPNFSAAFGCSNGVFCGLGASNRTSAWVFHLLNVDTASTQSGASGGTVTQGSGGAGTVPEPSTLAILGLGLAGLGMQVRRGRSRKATIK